MACFLSVCLPGTYTPCLTINLLHYTHTLSHTHRHSCSPALQHAKWKSTVHMIYISMWINDQISTATLRLNLKTLSDFTLKLRSNSTPAARWGLYTLLFLQSTSKQEAEFHKQYANIKGRLSEKSHRTWPHTTAVFALSSSVIQKVPVKRDECAE